MKKYLILLFLWIVLLPSILYANELPMTEQLFFKSQLKEYACKIIDPSLRHENNQLAALDIENLQEKIFRKLTSSEEHLKLFKKFIIENIWTVKIFSSFQKSLLDKLKFESLNNNLLETIDFDSLNNLDPLNSKANIILFDKFLFKLSFNSTINMPKFSEKYPQMYISASKNLEQEYYEITRDTQNITNEETLKKYGPSVIERSEKILFGNDESLRLDYVSNLIYYAGICRILLKHGMNLPETTKRKYLLEYGTTEIYQKVPLYNYKYAAFLFNLNIFEADKKYDDMLAFALKVKKDIFEQLIIDLKYDLVFKINYLIVYFCETKPERFEIGKENCYLLLNLVDLINSPYYPTSEHKRVLKLTYIFRFTAELYAKYKYYNEAVYELDYVIASPPPVIIPTIRDLAETHRTLVADAQKRKLELIPYMTIVTISFEGETLKKVYAYQNDNIYELILNIDTKSKSIPKNLSIEFNFTDSFSHYNDENKDPNKTFVINNGYKFLRNNSVGTDQKNFGFKSGNELKDTLILNNISETKVKIKFKYTSFGGDLFTIKAKTLSPYSAECSNQMQVWKKNTLKLYAMNNEINSKNLYPKVDFAIERLNECFIELIKEDNFPNEVKIPFHKKIFAEFPISVPPGEIGLTTFVEELGKISPEKIKFERQNQYINLIGCYEVHVKPTQNNPFPILRGFYLRGFGSQFGSNYTDKFFNSILMSYNELRDQEGKTLSHELGHAFGLEHPYNDIGTPGETKYEHQNSCLMYSGGSNPEGKFCENCIILIKNNFINIGGTEFKVNKKKH